MPGPIHLDIEEWTEATAEGLVAKALCNKLDTQRYTLKQAERMSRYSLECSVRGPNRSHQRVRQNAPQFIHYKADITIQKTELYLVFYSAAVPRVAVALNL